MADIAADELWRARTLLEDQERSMIDLMEQRAWLYRDGYCGRWKRTIAVEAAKWDGSVARGLTAVERLAMTDAPRCEVQRADQQRQAWRARRRCQQGTLPRA